MPKSHCDDPARPSPPRLPALTGGLRAAPRLPGRSSASGAVAIGVYFLLPPGRPVDLLRRHRLRVGGRDLRRRRVANLPRGRAAAVAPLRARAARPGGRRRDLRGLRGAAEPRAAVARRSPTSSTSRGYPLLALGVFLVLRAARRPDEPRRDPRHGRHLLRRRARAVGLLHRPVQPHALRDRGRAARRDGVPGDGRAAARRASRSCSSGPAAAPPRTACCSRASRSGWSPTRSTA